MSLSTVRGSHLGRRRGQCSSHPNMNRMPQPIIRARNTSRGKAASLCSPVSKAETRGDDQCEAQPRPREDAPEAAGDGCRGGCHGLTIEHGGSVGSAQAPARRHPRRHSSAPVVVRAASAARPSQVAAFAPPPNHSSTSGCHCRSCVVRLRNKILIGVAAFFGVAFAALAITVSYDSPCPPVVADASGAESMRAIMNRCYGVPEGVRLETIAKPTPAEGKVLIKVHAASVNPAEWYRISGQPSLIRLDERHWRAQGDGRAGFDVAGTVEAVGANVTLFKPGDEVFGGVNGALAEYAVAREQGAIVAKPAEHDRSRKPPPFRSPPSPHCRACAITAASRPARRCSSTAPPAAWAPTPCRSPSPSARKSPACAAPETSRWCVRSARITSSTTPRRTSPKARSATTSSWTTLAITGSSTWKMS